MLCPEWQFLLGRERLKDDAALYSRLDSPQSHQRRFYPGHKRRSCCNSLSYAEAASNLVYVVDPSAAMFVINAFRLGSNSDHKWTLS